MKTLKQILINAGFMFSPHKGCALRMMDLVKEWLKQKQEEKQRKTKHNDKDDDFDWAQSDMLDELLEELK